MIAGELEPPPKGSSVPSWLRAVVRHSSAGDPELAQASFEHALPTYATIEAPPAMVADPELGLAEILLQVPGREAGGERLFASAYARALAAGETGAPLLAKIRDKASELGITL
ncbi:hypothetical protein [Enhygromyxa salina]|uniref:Uncharacterized protein n=1 Tax=Enhygromyxa salina TaxID=215803 RepID=A0A2S9XKV3_9BACT|nr:hypothetical protein [Enhygromyxa salina]PRP93508.1 hypothetical protein ENSA7_79360 [Enhygromyxa salina]